MSRTIGIMLHGQQGDIMSALSVMKYREQLWGDAKIVWYADRNNFDIFKFQDIEVREFPRGFGYPEMVIEENRKLVEQGKEPIWEDWLPLVGENNHMNVVLKNNYPSLADIDYGYFPAPHQMSVGKRHGLSYPDCSKKVFGLPMDYEWHPVISFSDEEKLKAVEFMEKLPETKSILFETFAGSSQSSLTHEMIIDAIKLCKEKWIGCNIIFVSHKYLRTQETFPEGFFEQEGIYSASNFTVRQCSLLSHFCQLMISVSSGVTVACSAWGTSIPIIQFCGSWVCSTASMAKGRQFELVTADNKLPQQAQAEFSIRLEGLLNKYSNE